MNPRQPEILPAIVPASKETSLAAPDDRLSAVDIGALFAEAVKQGSAMEVIKELRAMEEEMYRRRAKQLFDSAMAGFKAECPVITKSRAVPTKSGDLAYRYAPIEQVETIIRPIELAHGFDHTFPITEAEPGWVSAICRIRHNGGHEQDSKVRYPIGTKTAIMSDTQQYAAAETFCKRRALCNGYGLTLVGEDMDGASGRPKPTGPSSVQPNDIGLKALAQELWTLLKPVRGPLPKWDAANQWLQSQGLLDPAIEGEAPNLSASRMKKLIEDAKKITVNQNLK